MAVLAYFTLKGFLLYSFLDEGGSLEKAVLDFP